MARRLRPIESLSPGYRLRIEGRMARGASRAEARGHGGPVAEHIVRRQRREAAGKASPAEREAFRRAIANATERAERTGAPGGGNPAEDYNWSEALQVFDESPTVRARILGAIAQRKEILRQTRVRSGKWVTLYGPGADFAFQQALGIAGLYIPHWFFWYH